MKFYGNANLQQNELQQAVIPIESAFPALPKVGRLAFVNSILYICVSITAGLPAWVPLTRELTLHTHIQDTASALWTINHALNSVGVQVQVFDGQGRVLIPDEITVVDSNTVTVKLGTGIVGSAVVLTGHNDGVTKPTYAFTHYQSVAASTWDITHNLGHHPIARVFVGSSEVQPMSIEHLSNTQMRITFTAPYAGLAKLV